MQAPKKQLDFPPTQLHSSGSRQRYLATRLTSALAVFLPALSTQCATPQLRQGDCGTWDLDGRDAAGPRCHLSPPHLCTIALGWSSLSGLALILCPGVSHLIEESEPSGHTWYLQVMALDLEFACYRAVQW